MLIRVHHLILIIKKNFLLLGDGPTDGFNDSTGAAEKTFRINFSKAKAKFCFSLQYSGDESYLYVNKTEICKFKANDNISWYNFCSASRSKDFRNDEHIEISLNSTLYDFSVGHSFIKKEDILNIHQYLMINIKCLDLF